ncbi:type II secretion system F family protein [Psychrobacillus sp. FSL H8-0510]|uniref:type II secretion system F family protein n=1 Tax=Psychrobacillus sp. FSL H8-0510 TaxID=2921394 RepID=UPI0030F96EAD
MHWILIGVALLVALLSMTVLSSKEDKLNKRKKQAVSGLRENVIKRKIDGIIEDKIKYSRRYNTETLCLQAGFPISYSELFIISVVMGIVLGLIMYLGTNNPLLGFLFLVIGFLMPKQVLAMIRNVRVTKMEKQVGSFIHMILKRYETTQDFGKAIHLSTEEFKGEEPVYSELKRLSYAVTLGRPIHEALRDMARSMGNRYVERLADYYEMAGDAGNTASRLKLLGQAYEQYEENRKGKALLKREIANVKRENYIMLAFIPIFAIYQVFTNDDYIRFMTETTMGQIGTASIAGVFVILLWFINNKIGAPLD